MRLVFPVTTLTAPCSATGASEELVPALLPQAASARLTAMKIAVLDDYHDGKNCSADDHEAAVTCTEVSGWPLRALRFTVRVQTRDAPLRHEAAEP